MNARERRMAVVALAAIFVFLGGFLGYQFILRPLKTTENRIRSLQDDVEKNERAKQELLVSMPRLKQMRKLSLPADVDMARREYEAELGKMLRSAEFAVGSYSVNAKPLENRTTAASKKPPFVRLVFDIQTRGELVNIIDFLDRFYRTPLLHRIRTLSLVRPVTATTRQRTNELDINISIEALIVDGAEKRETLLPKDTTIKRLARESAQYASIAGKDIFFGPPPPTPTMPVDDRPKVEVDITEFVVLDEITHDDRGPSASLYDAYNNRKYAIRGKSDGSFSVSTYWYVKDKKKTEAFGKELGILDEAGDPLMSFQIVRIGVTDIVLMAEDRYFRLQIGTKVSEMPELKKDQLKAMGIAVKEAKPVDKKPAELKAPEKKPAETKASESKKDKDGK